VLGFFEEFNGANGDLVGEILHFHGIFLPFTSGSRVISNVWYSTFRRPDTAFAAVIDCLEELR